MSNITAIRRAALHLLARREHSEQELFRKLLTKKFAENDIRTAIQQLSQENVLSNQRFLENYIHSRKNKGMGPLRIQMELQQRGIAQELIEDNLNISDNAWLAHAARVREKKFKQEHPGNDVKKRLQQMRFLQYRGFTKEQIEYVFKCRI